jgi:hypothetical protein
MLQQPPTARGFLASLDLTPPLLVEFQYNPREINDRRGVTYATRNAPGLVMPVRHYTNGGDRTFTFRIDLDGRYSGQDGPALRIAVEPDGSILPELNKYRAFMYPATDRWPQATGSFAPLFDENQEFASPPVCVFGWGDRLVTCVVSSLTIDEQVFNARLAPLRAKVQVTLTEIPPYATDLIEPPGGF